MTSNTNTIDWHSIRWRQRKEVVAGNKLITIHRSHRTAIATEPEKNSMMGDGHFVNGHCSATANHPIKFSSAKSCWISTILSSSANRMHRKWNERRCSVHKGWKRFILALSFPYSMRELLLKLIKLHDIVRRLHSGLRSNTPTRPFNFTLNGMEFAHRKVPYSVLLPLLLLFKGDYSEWYACELNLFISSMRCNTESYQIVEEK